MSRSGMIRNFKAERPTPVGKSHTQKIDKVNDNNEKDTIEKYVEDKSELKSEIPVQLKLAPTHKKIN